MVTTIALDYVSEGPDGTQILKQPYWRLISLDTFLTVSEMIFMPHTADI
jgi:hypothetical protein